MKLKPSQIPGFVEDYESPFPAAEMSNGVAGGAWADMAKVTAPARSWKCASRLTRAALGRVATTHGVFDRQVKAVKQIGDIGRLALGSDFVALAEGAKLVGELLDFSEAVDLVGSRVPVVGAYARLIVGFIKFLKNAFTRGGETDQTVKKTARDALGYNKEIDVDITNAAAESFADHNWTRIFLPSWKPGDSFTTTPTSYVGDGTPDGMTILPKSGALWEYGLGFVPGVAGRMVQWQYPLKVFGSDRPSSPWDSLLSIANLEPSVTQLTVLAWQMVLKNGPNMFRVDHLKVRERWGDYFAAVGDYGRWLEEKGRDHEGEMCRGVATWVGRQYVGGPLLVREPFISRFAKKDGSREPRKLPDWLQKDRGSLIRYIIESQLQKSHKPALGTLTCAYVGPGFAAIKADTFLREYWQDMRKLLLSHPARYHVELDMIPDRDYRVAMGDATRLPEPKFTATPPKDGFGGEPEVDPDAGKPPPDRDVEPSLPGEPTGGEGGGGGILAALAVLGLGYVGVKRLRKGR